jgi:hypothetical protein
MRQRVMKSLRSAKERASLPAPEAQNAHKETQKGTQATDTEGRESVHLEALRRDNSLPSAKAQPRTHTASGLGLEGPWVASPVFYVSGRFGGHAPRLFCTPGFGPGKGRGVIIVPATLPVLGRKGCD